MTESDMNVALLMTALVDNNEIIALILIVVALGNYCSKNNKRFN
jgi:hypothetical protein